MTAAPMRVLLAVERRSPARAGFEDLAGELARAGASVTLAVIDVEARPQPSPLGQGGPFRRLELGPPSVPLICGLGRSGGTAPLRASYALVEGVAASGFDLVLVPLGGGLGHGLLMQRATGASVPAPRIVVWAAAPTRWIALREDAASADLAPLVADALERASLRLADAVISPGGSAERRLLTLAEDLPPAVEGCLPMSRGARPPEDASRPLDEIVFVGRLSRRDGAPAFMDAIEELGRRDRLGGRRITFLGPIADPPDAFGASLLGVRAIRWPFRFGTVDTADEAEILAYLGEPGRLAVFAAEDADSDRVLRAMMEAGHVVVATDGYGLPEVAGGAALPGGDAASLADAIGAALEGGGRVRPAPAPTAWSEILSRLGRVPRRGPPLTPPGRRSVSVCLVHRFRPELLAAALASIRHGPDLEVDTVVVDNAAAPRFVADAPGPRVVRLERPVPTGAAYDRAVAACTGEVVVFLDDDNVLVDGGLERLTAGIWSGWFDVVVSSLDLVDGAAATGESSGRAIFLGDAGMAGLFFNGFGDTALAMRRDAFLRIGGSPGPGHLAPVWDWVLLAKARARGLRIGVLIDPAIRYARRIGDDDRNWVKLDREAGRRAVLEAYGDAVDGPFLARFAQALQSRM